MRRGTNAAVGDVITVTTASGGTEPGSLRWAASQATGGEIIRFAPSVANEIIRLAGPVVAQKYIAIEGPRDGKVDMAPRRPSATAPARTASRMRE